MSGHQVDQLRIFNEDMTFAVLEFCGIANESKIVNRRGEKYSAKDLVRIGSCRAGH